MRKFFLTVFLFLLGTILAFCEKGIYRFFHYQARIPETFLEHDPDIAYHSVSGFTDIILEHSFAEYLKEKTGFRMELLETETEIRSRIDFQYHTYSETETLLNSYESAYPGICKLEDIGDAWEKIAGGATYNPNYADREIYMLKISDNVSSDEIEPAILIMGAHHAREPISTEVVLFIIDKLLTQYGTDPDITRWVNSFELYFIPIVNPDGHAVVVDDIDLWWRKNCKDNNGNQSFIEDKYGITGDGVDPNRNYSWHWGGSGTSFNTWDETYCGTGPFSEPETRAIRDLAEKHDFFISVSYHSYGELVLYPFGYKYGIYTPDHDLIAGLGEKVASHIIDDSGTGYYLAQPSWALYPASGDSDDWLYGELGVFAYTVELTNTFIPAGSQIDSIASRNWEGFKDFLIRMEGPLVKGRIYDKKTGLPLEARITTDYTDTSSLTPRTSLESTGEYHRFLPPGTHQLRFSKSGYIPKTIEITLTNDPVEKDIYLTPLPGEFEFLVEPIPVPNPAKTTGYISIYFSILTEDALIECSILDITGNVVKDFEPGFSTGDPYQDRIMWYLRNNDGNRVASGIYIALLKISKDGKVYTKTLKLSVVQ